MNIRIRTFAVAALLAATLPAMAAAAPRASMPPGGGGTHMGAPGGDHGRPGRGTGLGRGFGYPGYYGYSAFSGLSGIENWVADSDDTVYLEAIGGRWYEVDLATPCFGLSDALRIGVDNGPMGSIDDVSNVIVNGQRCPVMAVNPVAGPPRRDHGKIKG